MTRQGRSGGGGTRTSQRPRRTMAAVSCTAVWAVVVFSACCVDVAHGFSSGAISCPLDIFSCLGDGECGACLNLLQDTGLTLGDVEFELCGELYAGTCVTAESVGCNVENEDLEELLACVFDDTFGCDDFTTCQAATATEAPAAPEAPAATEAPAFAPSAAPATTPAPSITATTVTPATATPAAVTTAPGATTAPAARTFPTPVFPLPSAAPTTGSRGIFSPPTATATPTADGSGAFFGTAAPSPAMFEGTMAPSESSAAPTGVDGLRGGIGSAFSAAPTAAPSGFQDLDDLEDGANGGVASIRHAGGGIGGVWSIVFATALAGLSSALAALAV